MSSASQARPSVWPALSACAIAAAFAAWLAMAEHGWQRMIFSPLASVFLAAALIWIVCVSAAIARQRQWWLLLTAPVVLFPIVMTGWLTVACIFGRCL